jgi:hypothetical protein
LRYRPDADLPAERQLSDLENTLAAIKLDPWLTFGVTTGVGILPFTIAVVVLGSQAGSLAWQWWLGLLAWLALRRLFVA